jgi:gliding motility-associated-like protein
MKKISQLKKNSKNKTKAGLLVLLFIFGINLGSKACSPLAIPTLSTQSIAGGSLQLLWVSNTAWACQYQIEVEIKCLGTPFNGIAPFFISPTITKVNNSPQVYPSVQAINLATLCPGTAYQFRAREKAAGGVGGALWTPTFTFVTPGQFILPIIQSMPNPTICPTNTTQLTAQLQNACGPGPISYSWSPATGLSCVSCSNPIASPTVQTTYTVVVTGGPLSCWVATSAVTVYTSSGSAQVLSTVMQLSCTNTLTAASLTTAGSASVPISITWSPAPVTISGNSLNASGLPVGVTTVVVTDQVGCVKTVTLNVLPAPPPVTFTINNLTGSNSITCSNPTINLQAVSNYTYGSISYSWTSPSFTANTTTVAITAPNSLTLNGTDPATGCTYSLTMAIGINTTAPSTTVNPTSQVITCAANNPVTFTGTASSPTVNIQHDWYSPLNPLPNGVPISSSNNTVTILAGIIPPGVYTLVTTNLVNGCKTLKTVTVTSLDSWPTFGINSTTNYSVGCIPLNQTTLSIINPVSTQTPPATCSYTFLPPGFAGVVPNGTLGVNTSTTTILPGTWTVIVNDNSNSCRTILTVPIIQNTIAPNVAAILLTQTLTCNTPTILATGTSSTPNSVISWDKPIAPTNVPSSTIIVGPGTGPNTSSTSLTYANYTVSATNTINACISTSVVVISQNFKKPVSAPNLSSGTPLGIYCTVADNPAILNTGASGPGSGVPNAFAANPCWAGPSPQTPTCGPSSYSCYVAGLYSLTIEDSYNGCTATQTIIISDLTQPPIITSSVATATLDCGGAGAALTIVLTGTNLGGVRYVVTDYPIGTAFTPTNATIFNANPVLSGTSSSLITASETGTYIYIVSNTLTGCQAQGTFEVTGGNLLADFSISPPSGYAPLGVDFTNLSSSSLNSASITSIWSFGNGTSQTTTTNINTSAIYTSPGTYTVMLLVQKGACLDTAYKTVNVDIPSKLEVPNVFTPNGDGSNDVFFLKTANLGEITALIYDRWGNKVYEITGSSTGNIVWDGKNLQGKDCAPGTYFYIITATGRDSKEYTSKGNISLFR